MQHQAVSSPSTNVDLAELTRREDFPADRSLPLCPLYRCLSRPRQRCIRQDANDGGPSLFRSSVRFRIWHFLYGIPPIGNSWRFDRRAVERKKLVGPHPDHLGSCTVFVGFVRPPTSSTSRDLCWDCGGGLFPGIVCISLTGSPRKTGPGDGRLHHGCPCSLVIGAPISALILQADWFDLAGWRWMFILKVCRQSYLEYHYLFPNRSPWTGQVAQTG